MEKYLNPFTDFGFKKLFGEEVNKDLLLDFLNELLNKEEGVIQSLTYLKNEQIGRHELDRRAIFDLYCTNERGEKFIVELQKTEQKFFRDRTVYYSTFPIQEQAKKGEWNFELQKVYTIAILDFIFDGDEDEPTKYRYDVKLTDIETNKVFYDKLMFIYLVMPKFNKEVEQLETRFEKWMYVFKNLNRLQRIPESLQEKIFNKIFEVAEIAKFNPDDHLLYEDSIKVYRDLKNSIDTAVEKGRIEGRMEGRMEGEQIGMQKGEQIGMQKGEQIGMQKGEQIGLQKGILQIAKNAKKMGMPINDIVAMTGLTKEEIENI